MDGKCFCSLCHPHTSIQLNLTLYFPLLLARDDDGIFNFEGGCYAKTINLKEESEPDIYRAIRKDALFENVKLNDDKTPDYFDVSLTENGRVSYPIFHIDGYVSACLCEFVVCFYSYFCFS